MFYLKCHLFAVKIVWQRVIDKGDRVVFDVESKIVIIFMKMMCMKNFHCVDNARIHRIFLRTISLGSRPFSFAVD